MRMHFPVRPFLLAALCLVTAPRAQKADGGLDAERRTATFFVSEDQVPPLAGVAISYTRAPWRAGYDAVLAPLQASNYTRLGNGWWTTLETIGPLELGGTKVEPGSYYLGLSVAADGAFTLLLFDSQRAMKARLLPATTALYTGEAKPDVRIPMAFTKDKAKDTTSLVIEMLADAKNPSRGTLVMRWGKHELSAPVVFDLAAKKPGNAPK